MSTNLDGTIDDPKLRAVLRTRAVTKAVEHLLGMVDGMLSDGHLHDREIQFLSTWLAENRDVTSVWPINVVARTVRLALADGVITESERKHLHETLIGLGADFESTGSVSAETCSLPIDDQVTVKLMHAAVCHTGAFMFGTRASCERASLMAGAVCADTVNTKVNYVVVGSRVSPAWAHTSFGRKIQRAAELRELGHDLEIISERRWVQALGSHAQ